MQQPASHNEQTTAGESVARIFAVLESCHQELSALATLHGHPATTDNEPEDHAAALNRAIESLLTAIGRGDYDHISPAACPAVANARAAQRAYWHALAEADIVASQLREATP